MCRSTTTTSRTRPGQASALDQRHHRARADAANDDDCAKPADHLAHHRIADHRHHVRHDTDARQLATSNQGASPRRLPTSLLSGLGRPVKGGNWMTNEDEIECLRTVGKGWAEARAPYLGLHVRKLLPPYFAFPGAPSSRWHFCSSAKYGPICGSPHCRCRNIVRME